MKTAIILCGGKGLRLRPTTYEIPKALIPIHGKPVIEHIIDLLKRHGIENVILSVGNLKEKIKDYFKCHESGVNIFFIEEETPLGTGGPLNLLKNKGLLPKETFAVSNGDELKSFYIQEMLPLHNKERALVTMAITKTKNPHDYGVVKLSGNKVAEFLEKPKDPPTNLINAGFYLMEPAVLDMIPKGFSMLENALFPKLAKEGKMCAFQFKGQWFDIGTPERYAHAEREWKDIS